MKSLELQNEIIVFYILIRHKVILKYKMCEEKHDKIPASRIWNKTLENMGNMEIGNQ